MQDDKTRWSLTVPLTPEQLAWWQERMRHTIAHLRETFPHARLVFRKLHRTDDAVQGTQYITNRACYSYTRDFLYPNHRFHTDVAPSLSQCSYCTCLVVFPAFVR